MKEVIDLLKRYTNGKQNTDKVEISVLQLNRVIKALEQESILDKIREEIEGYKSTIDNAISEDELKIEGMKEAYTDCLEIIDEYKVKEGAEEVYAESNN